jgi:hypothetical protein
MRKNPRLNRISDERPDTALRVASHEVTKANAQRQDSEINRLRFLKFHAKLAPAQFQRKEEIRF